MGYYNSCGNFFKTISTSFRIRGYNIVRFDRALERGGGIAFLVKNNLIVDKTSLKGPFKSLETGIINVQTSKGVLSVVACYRSPNANNNLTSQEWTRFLDEVINNGNDLLFIGGDLNAHHASWGSVRNCCNGNIIYNYTDPAQLTILNNGDYTHFNGINNTKSNIDLTIVSTNLALECIWKVETDNWRSDHFPISTFIDISAQTLPRNQFRYNTKRIDWEMFSDFWTNKTQFFYSHEFLNKQVTERYSCIVEHILAAIEAALPHKTANDKVRNVTKTNHKITNAIWWNETCERAIINKRNGKFCNIVLPRRNT